MEEERGNDIQEENDNYDNYDSYDNYDNDVDDDDDEYIGKYVREVIEEDDKHDDPGVIKEDSTIEHYSLLYNPPKSDMDYIDSINFTDYPTASHFAIVQQKGYSYPRFRSHEKTKIPKIQCEDKFRVTDILKDDSIIGRLFILADGHGGSGCSEYFVRKTPIAVNAICQNYDIHQLDTPGIQQSLQDNIKVMIQNLDDQYLALKRQQIHSRTSLDEHIDNDGCTLILNIFLGEWLINVNVGDSRTILVSAPEPTLNRQIKTANLTGVNSEYKMDVVFASQDHKPYLEHLARHILENGGEFVDSAHKRVIKVQLDKLRDDGRKNNKRGSLKKARIRPKLYNVDDDTARTPTLNVARSCGDLDFKMNEERKIISCEPDTTFIRISNQPQAEDKKKKRHFLFMSTDGTFDYMFEEIPEQQNRAIARVMGPMIEDGEKTGKLLLEQDIETPACADGEKIKNPTVQTINEYDSEELPRIPLLHRELTDEESKARTIKERTLVSSARYFADREGCHGFFAPTTQNYDDCTIILVEI
jgi:serine/threonine protein phosphatase PrpC